MTDAKQHAEAKPQEEQKPVEHKRNKDGLIPGQPVDFDTIRRIEAKRAKRKG